MQRRNFIKGGLLASTLSLQSSSSALTPIEFTPISAEERKMRVAKAQKLMAEKQIQAIILDAGINMNYFTGISWHPSERSMLAVIPVKGEINFICPAFEEDRFLEMAPAGTKVSIWEEDENPFALTTCVLKGIGIEKGQIGIDEFCRFFIFDGLRKSDASFQFVSADPITIPCRIIKSAAEIALMQKANDATVKAIQAGIAALSIGCTPRQISQKIAQAHAEQGAMHGFASVTFGVATSFPHGSSRKQILKSSDVVMLDCGCSVGGYESDITRTVVFGEPSAKQKQIWDLEKKAQQAGFEAAKLGAPAENVDFAARKVLIDAGFGPDYKLPGLPHRTGHGIGMSGHEWGNMVKGNKAPLEIGMCFSIEPTIAIPGEFGVRLEDCAYMTAEGPKWFSNPSKSISEPF
ncbi:M24 family metallopeptidase [Aquirufa antheringensis]|uniref:M24 family metallopeptidase n=1 Tax=Aquirufa antheringensis TaxID=2516559 RepID=UPI0022A9F2B6|nr:Xaa-Pro peptidase family protein [Aquirufa antheringensis]MCZ2484047.1 aminopeptidase P family protein [Aquirufa antheringensis]